MKAIRFMEPEVIEYSAVATPEPKDNEVLAQIAYAGFCATDIELLTGDMIHIKNGFTKYPIIPGHEWSGTIVAVGRDVRDLKVGDRITSDVSLGCGECDECRKGHYNLCPNREVVGSYRNRQGVFAEYVAVPQRHVYKIPENVSMEEAALAEPAATAMYAVSKAKIPAGAEVLVIGDGPIGQLAAQLANIAGASKVIMAGSWDEKLAIARSCGIQETINYHKEDVVLNRVLVWFGAAVVAELLLLLLNRYYINRTTRPGEIEFAAALYHAFPIIIGVTAAATVVCLVWTVLRFQKGKGYLLPSVLAWICGALLVISTVTYLFNAAGVSFQTTAPDSIVMVEQWESVAHLEAHLQTPHMKAWSEAVKGDVLETSIRILQAGV